jgi:hypothetical protein
LGAGDPSSRASAWSSRRARGAIASEGSVSGRRLLYTVRKRRHVFSISRQFQVSVTQLKSWNGLNSHHQIRAGQHLVMYVEPNREQG